MWKDFFVECEIKKKAMQSAVNAEPSDTDDDSVHLIFKTECTILAMRGIACALTEGSQKQTASR